ncbi:unnamed protein product [Caretta caretta]
MVAVPLPVTGGVNKRLASGKQQIRHNAPTSGLMSLRALGPSGRRCSQATGPGRGTTGARQGSCDTRVAKLSTGTAGLGRGRAERRAGSWREGISTDVKNTPGNRIDVIGQITAVLENSDAEQILE